MLLAIPKLRALIQDTLVALHNQGHDTATAAARFHNTGDRYDELWEIAQTLTDLPLRGDWSYREPTLPWDTVVAEMAADRPTDPIALVDLEDASKRVRTAFLGCCCGCILGKPIEIGAQLAELKSMFEKIGEWPIQDYVSQHLTDEGALSSFHMDWRETVRENIQHVAPDDDINYTILGMLLLEEHGIDFTHEHLRRFWCRNIPWGWTWGAERVVMLRAGLEAMPYSNEWSPNSPETVLNWSELLNPCGEHCGAQIRVDAYGYACPGRPLLAAKLAWRDAVFTHRRTGVYAAMLQAAMLAIALVERDPVTVCRTALQFIPQHSRLFEMSSRALDDVETATTWEAAYDRIHERLGQYSLCMIYQETACLFNTLKFARSIGDGICIQNMQGNDTDSYGARAGSLLGCLLGPGHLEERWLAPFHDRIHTTLATFHEQRLSVVAERMARLPFIVAKQIETQL